MNSLIAAGAVALFAAAPVLAADVDTNANSQGGKPSTSVDTGANPAAKNAKSYDSTGSSTGMSGTGSQQLPGSADSAKPDSSLSTNGNTSKPRQ